MTEKDLFIPLMTRYYEAFLSGEKTEEFRPYGPRWNERTCRTGRGAVIAKGYNNKRINRRRGVVAGFRMAPEIKQSEAWQALYGDRPDLDPCAIHIVLE